MAVTGAATRASLLEYLIVVLLVSIVSIETVGVGFSQERSEYDHSGAGTARGQWHRTHYQSDNVTTGTWATFDGYQLSSQSQLSRHEVKGEIHGAGSNRRRSLLSSLSSLKEQLPVPHNSLPGIIPQLDSITISSFRFVENGGVLADWVNSTFIDGKFACGLIMCTSHIDKQAV
jgi:hypothetical protein